MEYFCSLLAPIAQHKLAYNVYGYNCQKDNIRYKVYRLMICLFISLKILNVRWGLGFRFLINIKIIYKFLSFHFYFPFSFSSLLSSKGGGVDRRDIDRDDDKDVLRIH